MQKKLINIYLQCIKYLPNSVSFLKAVTTIFSIQWDQWFWYKIPRYGFLWTSHHENVWLFSVLFVHFPPPSFCATAPTSNVACCSVYQLSICNTTTLYPNLKWDKHGYNKHDSKHHETIFFAMKFWVYCLCSIMFGLHKTPSVSNFFIFHQSFEVKVVSR